MAQPSGLANPMALLQAISDAIEDLRAVDTRAAEEARRSVLCKPLGELSQEDLTQIHAEILNHRGGPAKRAKLSHLERDFGSFIDAIPDGRSLVDDIETLALSSDFDQLVVRADRVFIDHLGYTRARVDESNRISRSEFKRIERLGTFGEFDVVCVALTSRNWYAVFYDVIFRLHPYALVLSLEPNGGSLRFVYRDGPGKTPRYRPLTGPQTDWEPNDNLLVWAWRLHEIRPRIGETSLTLQRRVSRALDLSPEDVGKDWPSTVIDAATPIPGVPWEDAPRRAFESFVQLGSVTDERRRWGLEAVFRDRFPMAVAKDETIRLNYRGYELGEDPPSISECMDRGCSRERHVELLLDVQAADEARGISFRCTLPEPDRLGRFVLDGVLYTFAAEARDDGRLAALPESLFLSADGEAEVEALSEDLDPDVEDPETTALETQAESEEVEGDGQAPVRNFRGLGPRAFYEYAVSRKLAGLSYCLWRTFLRRDESAVDQVLRRVLRFGRRLDHLPLVASTVFRRFLCDQPMPSIHAGNWRSAACPPSWSCLDASSMLVSRFYPVAAARMHPTGSLAIPLQQGPLIRMGLSSASATEINPRALRVPSFGRSDWWIASHLRPFADLPVGRLESPHLGGASSSLQARIVCISGSETRAWVVESLQLSPSDSQCIRFRAPGNFDARPKLLVGPGTRVEPGKAWLELDRRSWPSMRQVAPMPEEDLALTILRGMGKESLAADLERDPRLIQLIPSGLRGAVTSVSLEPVVDFMGIERSWIARIQIRPNANFDGAVIGPDGATYPVAGVRSVQDMPFDAYGQPFDIVVESPRVNEADPISSFVDGISGDTLQGTSPNGPWRWAYWPKPVVGPEQSLRFRAVDGEGIPGNNCSPALSERDRIRWLVLNSAAAQPLVHASLQADRPCWTSRLVCVARAAGALLTEDLLPSTTDYDLRPGKPHDPMISRLHKPLTAPELGSCLELPIEVIHPWRKDAASAVLGVTSAELDQLLEAHGLSIVGAAILESVHTAPYEAALLRIEREPERRTKTLVAAGLTRLKKLLRQAHGEKLFLRGIPIPSPELLPFGTPPGASRVVRTPLLRRYRMIQLACRMVEEYQSGPVVARRMAEFELQRAVDSLFGARVGSPPLGHDLAGWLTRLWPLTRPLELQTAMTNLEMMASRVGPVPSIAGGKSGPISMPMPPMIRRPADRSWWLEHAARRWITEERLCWFLGLFACLDLPTFEPQFRDVQPSGGTLGEWTAREWLRRIENVDAHPSRLLQLLESPMPTQLSTEPKSAEATIDVILRDSLPGSESSALLLRQILSRILTGFWLASADEMSPSGWRWHGPTETPQSKARRYLPPFSSPAWSEWPCIEAAVAAPQLVLDLEQGQPIPPLLKIVSGFSHSTALNESQDFATEANEDATSSSNLPIAQEIQPPLPLVQSVVPPTPSDTDVMPTTVPLRQWLQATRNQL